MIPKKIHYCWFGKKPLPDSAKKCIDSWRRFFPDYEIIEWNEDNYNVNKLAYLREAYSVQKYAFVSDYARYDILYNEGGIYFDVDVEVIQSFDEILKEGPFMGCECDGSLQQLTDSCITGKLYDDFSIRVNPGLGMAAEKGMRFCAEFLALYDNAHFIKDDGGYNSVAVVANTTNLLGKYGLCDINEIQCVADFTIYPREYFNPYSTDTGLVSITSKTRSIHWFSLSWMSNTYRLRVWLLRMIRRMLLHNKKENE